MSRAAAVMLLVVIALLPGARAQTATPSLVGFLHSATPEGSAHLLAALRRGLSEQGYTEGSNLSIDFRWAEGRYDRLPQLAAALLERRPAVIIAVSDPAALAARAATRTVPVVFNTGTDPEQLGLVAGLSRPGGNLTGVSQMNNALAAKRLELLVELVPGTRRIGYLVNDENPNAEAAVADVRRAAGVLGVAIEAITAASEQQLEAAFERASDRGIAALLISSDPLLLSRRERIVSLAAGHRLPSFYTIREYVAAGGLISYSASRAELYRQTGLYAGRILKGMLPADLPVQQPTRFELVINLRTAKALGLDVPATLLARADEVIE